MKSKYVGKCFKCQKLINIGNNIYFNTTTRNAHCWECGIDSNAKPLGDVSTSQALEEIKQAEERKRLEPKRSAYRPPSVGSYKVYGKTTYSRVQKMRET